MEKNIYAFLADDNLLMPLIAEAALLGVKRRAAKICVSIMGSRKEGYLPLELRMNTFRSNKCPLLWLWALWLPGGADSRPHREVHDYRAERAGGSGKEGGEGSKWWGEGGRREGWEETQGKGP